MKIAVIMGGTSFEREFSLKSGERIARELEAKGHAVVPLDATEGLTSALRAEAPDVAFIAVHGLGGEDGTIQELLEFLEIPYVGSSCDSCRASWNKVDLPRAFKSHASERDVWRAEDFEDMEELIGDPSDREELIDDMAASLDELGLGGEHRADRDLSKMGDGVPRAQAIATPPSFCLTEVAFRSMGAAGALDLVGERLGYPVAVKPACGGSAMGVARVDTQEGLGEAIMGALSFDDKVIIQRWIEGVELSVSVVRDDECSLRSLPAVEIVPHDTFFTTAARLDPDSVDFFVPAREESLCAQGGGRTADEVSALIGEVAFDVFEALACRDLARIDMILSQGDLYVIDVKVAPGMTENSLLPMAAAASDVDLGGMLDALARLAARRGI